MQKGSLLLCVASLGIAWVHASTTSAGYCCPQITVALGTEDDGTYNFLTEGNGPAMEQCQDACIYYKDSNKTDIYCFQAVTSEALGSGQVQCEAVSPYSLLMSTTPAVTGPTAEELLKKIEDLQKPKTVWCGYNAGIDGLTQNQVLTFDKVVDALSSGTSQGVLGKDDGVFVPEVAGTYLITLTSNVVLHASTGLEGKLETSGLDEPVFFNVGYASTGLIRTQVAASRYVKMAVGDALYISLLPTGASAVGMYSISLCVSLVDAA